MARPIRVLVVDDSVFMRKVIGGAIDGQPDMEVAGEAGDGLEALRLAASLKPDVMTLDVQMPRLDGLATLDRLMREQPLPVIMVSSETRAQAAATVQALTLGAVDFVPKPSGSLSIDFYKVKDDLVSKIRVAARTSWGQVGGTRQAKPAAAPPAASGRRAPRPPTVPAGTNPVLPARLVVVGASTGGPKAVYEFLMRLPGDLPAGLLVVQHMPPGFTASFASHLNSACALTVKEAADGDLLAQGTALIAPGGMHLVLEDSGRVRITQGEPRHGVRPAVDVTLEALPERWRASCHVIILTGMGIDGAAGAHRLHTAGSRIWAQDEASSVVFGMPRAVAEMGIVERTGNPGSLAAAMLDVLRGAGRDSAGSGEGAVL